MVRYVFWRVPVDVAKQYKGLKIDLQNDIRKVTGNHKLTLTMPKVLRALIEKNNEITGIIPFNRKHLINLAKEKRR